MQPFSGWLDAFFTAYYRRRPVSATFIGVHDYDAQLPDLSDAAVEETRAEMASLRAALDDGTFAPPATDAERIDRRLAEHFLIIQDWEYTSHHFQRGNPCVYTAEAVFGVISLFLRPFAPVAERVDNAIARMQAIPGFLAAARANITHAPRAWTERAIQECAGAAAFFDTGIDCLIADEGIRDNRLRAAADVAARAFADYCHYLATDLLAQSTDAYTCGSEAFAMYLKLGHELRDDPTEILRYARDQCAAADAALHAGASMFGASDWRAALAQLAAIHPSATEYYGRYQEVWGAAQKTAVAHDLMTWLDYPIRYVPQPAWAREAAPHLYFLYYRSPAPYDRLPVHDYLVAPIEPDMPTDEHERQLHATNDSVIKLNHVIHHGGIGHHVQNSFAFRAASRVGQVAAVDCAARIAMFCGGTMAEGWSSYVVDLMGEIGFLTPLERYSQHHARLRAAARAIVDISLHCGMFTFDHAVAFYRDAVGMPANAARNEVIKNSMFPGAAMIYLIGQDAIRDLRREIAQREGAAFSLRRFHNRLLSFGSIPVALTAEAMRAESGASPV